MDSDKIAIAFGCVMGPLALIVAFLVWENAPRNETIPEEDQSALRQEYERDRQRFEQGIDPDAPTNSGQPGPPQPPKPVQAAPRPPQPVAYRPPSAPPPVLPPSSPVAPYRVPSAPPPPLPLAEPQTAVAANSSVPGQQPSAEREDAKTVVKLNFDMPQSQMKLEDGSLIDLTETFDEISELVEKSREKASAPLAMTLTYPNNKPMIYLSRAAEKLDGMSVAFYEFGNPMTCASYEDGKRDGSFCAWDDKDRPIYLLQYKADKKHGYFCIFRSCDAKCNHAHLWMVQEWKLGKLYATHYVKHLSVVTHRYDGIEFQPFERDPEFSQATNEMNSREKHLDNVERPAKQWAIDYTNYLRVSSRLNRAIAAQNRAILQERMRITVSVPQPRITVGIGYSCGL